MPRREKPWDCALASETACAVRKRRMNPDGVEHPVSRKLTKAGLRNILPWGALGDGDFFIVEANKAVDAQRVSFCQAAARHDIEISVHPWKINTDGGEPISAFRVIRVIGGIRKIKAEARRRGANAPSSDIKHYYHRQRAARRGEVVTTHPAISIAPTPPTAPPVAPGEAATAPLGTDAGRRYDRAAQMAENLRRARMLEAGLDPDEDEDFMGVGGEVGEAKV